MDHVFEERETGEVGGGVLQQEREQVLFQVLTVGDQLGDHGVHLDLKGRVLANQVDHLGEQVDLQLFQVESLHWVHSLPDGLDGVETLLEHKTI